MAMDCRSHDCTLGIACDEIELLKGRSSNFSRANAHAVFTRALALKSCILAIEDAAIASNRGGSASMLTANALAMAASSDARNSVMRLSAEAAIESSKCGSHLGRRAQDHAVFARA